MAASYDLFGNLITLNRWDVYMTGGEKGPGGALWKDAHELRKKMRRSLEFKQMGWDGSREQVLWEYLSPLEKIERQKVYDRKNWERGYRRGA